MAIQMRRGSYDNFDKSKMLEGEWAIVLENDPQATDGKSVYVTFAAGNTKRMATYEDMATNVKTAIETGEAEIIATLTDEVKEVNNNITTAETDRVSAEKERVTAEASRVSAEKSRVSAESARVKAESSRVDAEAARVKAESARATAETERQQNETARVSAESARADAETARATAEVERQSAETARAAAESSREQAETSRVTAESARVTAESGRDTAEAARVKAETERQSAEQQRAADQIKNNTDQAQNNAAAKGMTYHVCSQGEYELDPTDQKHNIPTVEGKTGVMYLTPMVEGSTAEDQYDQWMYIDSAWELMGGTSAHIDPVTTDDIDTIISNVSGTTQTTDTTRYVNTADLDYYAKKAYSTSLTAAKNYAAAKSHTHAASAITSGTLPLTRGGTGVTSLTSLRSSLGFVRFGIVTAKTATTVDVTIGSTSYSGVSILTSCAGVQVGDTVEVTSDGSTTVVTGVVATADNVPYVKVSPTNIDSNWTVSAFKSGQMVMFKADLSGSVSGTEGWSKNICTLPEGARPAVGFQTVGFMATQYWNSVSAFKMIVNADGAVAYSFKGFSPNTMSAYVIFSCG